MSATKDLQKINRALTASKGTMLVMDEESGKWHEVTPERKSRARMLINEYQNAWIKQCLALNELIGEERLYLDAGFSNVSDLLDFLNLERRSAEHKRKVGAYLSSLGNNKLLDSAQEIGYTKLRTLTQKISMEEFKRFIDENRLAVPEGTTLTVEEIKEMTVRELSVEFKRREKEASVKMQRLKAETEVAKSEVKVISAREKKMQRDMEKLQKELNMYKQKHGPKVSGLKEKMELLEEVHTVETHLFNLINRVEIEEDDPPELLEKFAFVTNLIVAKVEANAHAWRAIVDAAETAQ